MNKTKLFSGIILSIASLSAAISSAEVRAIEAPDTKLITYLFKGVGFEIEFIQLLPDFVRAIYGKHNFTKAEIERVAAYCVFGTILKNTSEEKMSYKVSNWQYFDANDIAYKVKTKAQWLGEWKKLGITFSWTLLPESGEFEVGDWQQGFTTIKIARDESFDLSLKWEIGGVQYDGKIKNMQCAPEEIKIEQIKIDN